MSLVLCLLLLGGRLVSAQYGGFGVGSGCFSNLNCGGNTICQNQRCVCPSNFQQVGQNCMNVVQPGGWCNGAFGGFGNTNFCGGGSFCNNNNVCTCPQNTIQTGSICQPQNNVYPGQNCNMFNQCTGGSFCQNNVCNCPTGQITTPTGCFGGNQGGFGIISPGQSCGNFNQGICGGGSYCNQGSGACTCPQNCIVQNNQCIPMGFGNNFNLPYQPTIPVGGNCNQQSQCGTGAQCISSNCQCGSGYYPQGGNCYRKKFYRSV